jgi:hypothetical protein
MKVVLIEKVAVILFGCISGNATVSRSADQAVGLTRGAADQDPLVSLLDSVPESCFEKPVAVVRAESCGPDLRARLGPEVFGRGVVRCFAFPPYIVEVRLRNCSSFLA